MSESVIRFEIGFVGGGSVAGTAAAAQVQSLEEAVRGGTGGPIEITTADGARLVVRVDHVAFFRLHPRDARVGF